MFRKRILRTRSTPFIFLFEVVSRRAFIAEYRRDATQQYYYGDEMTNGRRWLGDGQRGRSKAVQEPQEEC